MQKAVQSRGAGPWGAPAAGGAAKASLGRAGTAGLVLSIKEEAKQINMNTTLFGPDRPPQEVVDMTLEIRRLKDIQKELQNALRNLRTKHHEELAATSAEHRVQLEDMRAH